MINAVGLFILIAFLGYGLVEVPRMLWNKGNTEGQIRYLKFRVATQSEALQNARRYARHSWTESARRMGPCGLAPPPFRCPLHASALSLSGSIP